MDLIYCPLDTHYQREGQVLRCWLLQWRCENIWIWTRRITEYFTVTLGLSDHRYALFQVGCAWIQHYGDVQRATWPIASHIEAWLRQKINWDHGTCKGRFEWRGKLWVHMFSPKSDHSRKVRLEFVDYWGCRPGNLPMGSKSSGLGRVDWCKREVNCTDETCQNHNSADWAYGSLEVS